MNENNTQNVIPNVNSKGQEERNVPDLRYKEFADEWIISNISNAFTLLTNNSLSRDDLNYDCGCRKNIHYGDILTKYTTVKNITDNDVPYINDNIKISNSSIKLISGDIIVADTAEDYTVGKAIEIYDPNSLEIYSGLHTIPLRPKHKFAVGYLAYYFNSYNHKKRIFPLIQGIKVYSISKSALSSSIIKFPTLEEQDKIAQILIKLDARISTQKKIIEDLLSSKIIIKNKMIHKAKEIGNYYTLKELGQYFNGVAHENNISEQGYVLINSKFISSDGTIKKHVNDSSFVLKKNDICIVLSDLPNGKALSKCFFVNKDNYYALNQRIACIRTNDISFSKYLYYYLSRNDYFLKFDDGVSQTNLKKDDVLNCPIYYSDFVKKYIEYLEIIDIKIKNEKQILLLYEQQKQYLLDKMFI